MSSSSGLPNVRGSRNIQSQSGVDPVLRNTLASDKQPRVNQRARRELSSSELRLIKIEKRRRRDRNRRERNREKRKASIDTLLAKIRDSLALRQLERELGRKVEPSDLPRLAAINEGLKGGLKASSPAPLTLTYSAALKTGLQPSKKVDARSSRTAALIPEKPVGGDMMKTASISPESAGQGAKPLTYTTVGSVIKADEPPTFAPPVRIHREGANRRPSGTSNQNRNTFDSHNPRTHAHTFRQNLLHQHNFVDQANFHDTTSQYSPLNSNTTSFGVDSSNTALARDENSVLEKLDMPRRSKGSRGTPSSLRNNPTPLTNITNNSQKPDSVQDTEQADMGLLNNNGGPPRGTQAPPATIAGLNPLNKMQSLQRLSQYPNPMQEMAKTRLAEFSVNRSQLLSSENATPRVLPPLVLEPPPKHVNTNVGKNLIMALEKYDPKESEMNYRCPTPIPTQSSTSWSNDAWGESGARSPSTSSNNAHGHQPTTSSMTTSYPQTQQGYPKPLTAGPPGQRMVNPLVVPNTQNRPTRQHGDASRQALESLHEIVEIHAKRDNERSREINDDEILKQLRKRAQPNASAAAFKNPWNDKPVPQRPSTRVPQSRMYDTCTPADINKFYKGGLPSDYNFEKLPSPLLPASAATFDSEFLYSRNIPDTPRSIVESSWAKANPATIATSHQSWLGTSSEQPGGRQPGRGQVGDSVNPTDGWWYSGLRRIGMTAEEHMEEFENKKWRMENGYPEPTPPPGTATDHKPFTMEEIRKMDNPEMMKHLLNPAFSTFLSLADPNPGPAGAFNRFRPTESRYRDNTAEGNVSLYGEDWGRTPGQTRYQQNKETLEKAKEASDRFLVNNPPMPIQPEWKTQAADGRREGRQLWKKQQNKPPSWIGPHGFEKERGLDRGFDTADLVDFENGGIMKAGITIPAPNPNKKPAQKVGTAVVPHSSLKKDNVTEVSARQLGYTLAPITTPASKSANSQVTEKKATKSMKTTNIPKTTSNVASSLPVKDVGKNDKKEANN